VPQLFQAPSLSGVGALHLLQDLIEVEGLWSSPLHSVARHWWWVSALRVCANRGPGNRGDRPAIWTHL